MNIKLTIPWI